MAVWHLIIDNSCSPFRDGGATGVNASERSASRGQKSIRNGASGMWSRGGYKLRNIVELSRETSEKRKSGGAYLFTVVSANARTWERRREKEKENRRGKAQRENGKHSRKDDGNLTRSDNLGSATISSESDDSRTWSANWRIKINKKVPWWNVPLWLKRCMIQRQKERGKVEDFRSSRFLSLQYARLTCRSPVLFPIWQRKFDCRRTTIHLSISIHLISALYQCEYRRSRSCARRLSCAIPAWRG